MTEVVMAPLPPIQVVLAVIFPLTFIGGLVLETVVVAVVVQPLAPVTVTLKLPAETLLMSSVVAPFDHK